MAQTFAFIFAHGPLLTLLSLVVTRIWSGAIAFRAMKTGTALRITNPMGKSTLELIPPPKNQG